MVLILTEEQLIQLGKASKEQFKGSADYYEFLMFEIQGHMVEINDL